VKLQRHTQPNRQRDAVPNQIIRPKSRNQDVSRKISDLRKRRDERESERRGHARTNVYVFRATTISNGKTVFLIDVSGEAERYPSRRCDRV